MALRECFPGYGVDGNRVGVVAGRITSPFNEVFTLAISFPHLQNAIDEENVWICERVVRLSCVIGRSLCTGRGGGNFVLARRAIGRPSWVRIGRCGLGPRRVHLWCRRKTVVQEVVFRKVGYLWVVVVWPLNGAVVGVKIEFHAINVDRSSNPIREFKICYGEALLRRKRSSETGGSTTYYPPNSNN